MPVKTVIGTNISIAADLLGKDEVIAVPTETVYGLAGNALSQKAVRRIYRLKGRDYTNPLTIQLDSFEKAGLYVENIPDIYTKIADKFCPGPVTFIFKKNSLVPGFVTAGADSIGIRIPSHPLMLQLLQKLNFPLAVTSANPSGMPDAKDTEEVYSYFKNHIPYILDGGTSTVGKPSTVIGIQNGELIILREGTLSLRELTRVL